MAAGLHVELLITQETMTTQQVIVVICAYSVDRGHRARRDAPRRRPLTR